MNAVVIAIVAENAVLLAAIGAAWHLLRQGGGLQLKSAPAGLYARGESRPKKSEEAMPE